MKYQTTNNIKVQRLSAISLEEFNVVQKINITKNTILSMNRRQREHRLKHTTCFKSLWTFKR